MSIEELQRAVAGIPHMTPDQGREIAAFIEENGLRRCLELGFAHGAGTAYIASAAIRLGGRVVTIDLESARSRTPDIHETLRRAGIDESAVEIHFEPTSYTWRMMRFLAEGQAGSFDFVFLDGAHSWFVDGLAFTLAERLLRPGGWILFDDLNWRFSDPGMKGHDWVEGMPPEEREAPQVRMIWDLLVKASPAIELAIEKGNWGYARKAAEPTAHSVVYRYHPLITTLIDFKNYVRWHLIR